MMFWVVARVLLNDCYGLLVGMVLSVIVRCCYKADMVLCMVSRVFLCSCKGFGLLPGHY